MFHRLLAMLGVLALTACAYVPATGPGRAPEAEARIDRVGSSQAPELLGKLVGHWVLTGNIAGESVVHDVDADWVLQDNYVRISEVSRERGGDGQPSYEATIFVGWLESRHQFACIWLDNTEVASGEVACLAARTPDSFPFEFRDRSGKLLIATTFAYDRNDDTWGWKINNVEDGHAIPFADLSLRRR